MVLQYTSRIISFLILSPLCMIRMTILLIIFLTRYMSNNARYYIPSIIHIYLIWNRRLTSIVLMRCIDICKHRIRIAMLNQAKSRTEWYSRWKSSQDTASSQNLVSTIGAQTLGAQTSPKKGDGTRCPEGWSYLSLLACHTSRKCSIGTSLNSVKVEFGTVITC